MEIAVLCQPSDGHKEDWKRLYESSFPKNERLPTEEVCSWLDKGEMRLHVTRGSAEEVLCFSLISLFSDFILLAYIATDENKRSLSCGSQHMKRLLKVLKDEFPERLGVFLEIESTTQTGISREELETRMRRRVFYERLGAANAGKDYPIPALRAEGSQTIVNLLWFDFGSKIVDRSSLVHVLLEVYELGYELSADHPLMMQIRLLFET